MKYSKNMKLKEVVENMWEMRKIEKNEILFKKFSFKEKFVRLNLKNEWKSNITQIKLFVQLYSQK